MDCLYHWADKPFGELLAHYGWFMKEGKEAHLLKVVVSTESLYYV